MVANIFVSTDHVLISMHAVTDEMEGEIASGIASPAVENGSKLLHLGVAEQEQKRRDLRGGYLAAELSAERLADLGSADEIAGVEGVIAVPQGGSS